MINIERQYDDIYVEYYHAVLIFARSKGLSPHIAEEVVTETFTRLWAKRKGCKFDDPDDRVNKRMLKTWLYRAAENVILEFQRKIPDADSLEALADTITAEDQVEKCIEDIRYEEYLVEIEKELTEEQRAVFRAVFVEQLSYKEAQTKLKITGTALRSTISRLRKRLRPYINDLIQKNK